VNYYQKEVFDFMVYLHKDAAVQLTVLFQGWELGTCSTAFLDAAVTRKLHVSQTEKQIST
jgi:hypothetical protein